LLQLLHPFSSLKQLTSMAEWEKHKMNSPHREAPEDLDSELLLNSQLCLTRFAILGCGSLHDIKYLHSSAESLLVVEFVTKLL
jgi:hypothetical protein